MKNLLASTAIALALAAGSAIAADLPSRKEAPVYVPPPPPPPMWTGFYVGLNIGGGWAANGGKRAAICPTPTRPTGDRQHAVPRRQPEPVLPARRQHDSAATPAASSAALRSAITTSSAIPFVIGAETDFQGTSITAAATRAIL